MSIFKMSKVATAFGTVAVLHFAAESFTSPLDNDPLSDPGSPPPAALSISVSSSAPSSFGGLYVVTDTITDADLVLPGPDTLRPYRQF